MSNAVTAVCGAEFIKTLRFVGVFCGKIMLYLSHKEVIMDQIKTGRFIKACRKEKNLTQRELAEKLNISEKTVSKWETGNGLPEVNLMLPLCELLQISVNELLSGERLDEKRYIERAEQNFISLMDEKAQAKKKIILAILVVVVTFAAGFTLIILPDMIETEIWLKIVLSVLGATVILMGIAIACVLEKDAGVYECKHCKERFVPTMTEYLLAPHLLTSRRLKCPKCGKRSYCKKRLGRQE